MAPAGEAEWTFKMNAVICVFNIDKESFHGVSSIKTDIKTDKTDKMDAGLRPDSIDISKQTTG